jgi:poly(hydroxyalkanoate) depolymerase family esterase
MNEAFAKAMRLSLNETRAGNPMAATRLIQQALNGTSAAPSPTAEASQTQNTPRIEAAIEEAEVVHVTPPRRPLREVVAGLAKRPPGVATRAPRRAGKETPPAVSPGARFERRQFVGSSGARDYRLFLPAGREQGLSGLVVMLHGCTQSPEDFAVGTAMNAQAERDGFAVVWPEQTRAHNASLCWNWFRAADQGRAGEPAILHGIAESVAAEFAAPQVYVAGLSAGGGMAAILGHAYPETFSAVGVHSGLAPRSAQDVMSAFATMRGDAAPAAEAVRTPVIVFHGTDDRTVAPVNAARVTGELSAPVRTGGKSSGRQYSVTKGRTAAGHPAEVWTIEGAGHAWSGGQKQGSYADPAGPDATAEMARFFLAQSRRQA